jgi:hypothetical protein
MRREQRLYVVKVSMGKKQAEKFDECEFIKDCKFWLGDYGRINVKKRACAISLRP